MKPKLYAKSNKSGEVFVIDSSLEENTIILRNPETGAIKEVKSKTIERSYTIFNEEEAKMEPKDNTPEVDVNEANAADAYERLKECGPKETAKFQEEYATEINAAMEEFADECAEKEIVDKADCQRLISNAQLNVYEHMPKLMADFNEYEEYSKNPTVENQGFMKKTNASIVRRVHRLIKYSAIAALYKARMTREFPAPAKAETAETAEA